MLRPYGVLNICTIGGRPTNMDSLSPVSMQEGTPLNYFPSAVLESPTEQIPQPALFLEPTKSRESTPSQCNNKFNGKDDSTDKNMAVIINIGPSRQPVPLMQYDFISKNAEKEEEMANQELIIMSKLIQTKFSNLIFDTCSLLQSSSIEKLQMWLSFQSCSQSVQSLRAFENDSDAFRAKTIPALISSLQCYTSWYNYELIADIARKFCGDEGSTLVEAYEMELKHYLKTLIIHCPPLFPNHENLTKSLHLFEGKVAWDPSTTSLEDIAIFKSVLCKLCNLDPRFLVIKMINLSNFQMTWAYPKAATKIIKEFKHDSLLHKGATQLSGSETELEVLRLFERGVTTVRSSRLVKCNNL